jgi:hypothetical protein
MPHIYDVQTNKGGVEVATAQHHDHISRAEFERILLQTASNLLGTAAQLGGQIVLHRYTYKGHR